MNRKIPEDAFQTYVSLGPGRSYQTLADSYNVSKRAIQERASREEWSARLEKIERVARDRTDEKLAEALGDMTDRHLKILRAMSTRVINALTEFRLGTGMEGMRAAEMVIKLERLISGEPSERTAVSIEETIKREYQQWLEDDDEVDEPAEDDDGEAA